MMSTRMRALCLGVLLTAGGAAALHAQPGTDETDHEALRVLKRVFEQAVAEDRVELLQPYLHANFSGVMITSEPVGSFDDLRAYWRKIKELMGQGGRYTTTVNPDRSLIFGTIALAKGTTDDVVVTGNGAEYRFNSRWTAVLAKQNADWKILRVQGTIDPLANPFVATAMRRTASWTGGVGAIVGLLIGWLLSLVIRRRRARPSGS